MTREKDVALGNTINADLNARSDISNNAKVDYFISIHCNSSANSLALGIETFCYKFNSVGEKHVKRVVELGIMNGNAEGYFNPKEPVTREELAAVASNIVRYITGK